ncbi:hypothetical protein AGMMS50276_29370 [Synergistales bacterium]|nr:hypothetical protein AGMMS50276_29370 [Synergistales bacterium]
MHSLEVFERLYQGDTVKIRQKMRELNFDIYPNTYANMPSTILSFFNLFTGNPFVISDAEYHARNLMTWQAYNPIYEILKNNGYSINAFLMNDYLGYRADSKIDSMVVLSEFYNSNETFNMMTSLIHKDIDALIAETKSLEQINHNMSLELLAHVEKRSASNPSFCLIYAGAAHMDFVTYQIRQDWEKLWNAAYSRIYRYSIDTILYSVQRIVEKDPEALIVFIGDHGAQKYGAVGLNVLGGSTALDDIRWQHDNPGNPASAFQSQGLTETDIADDVFSTLCAVRWPVPNFTNGRVLSHANLFRHIFAALLEDLSILDYCVPNISQVDGWLAVHEGRPLKRWVRMR